jgi:hypothetical protein
MTLELVCFTLDEKELVYAIIIVGTDANASERLKSHADVVFSIVEFFDLGGQAASVLLNKSLVLIVLGEVRKRCCDR